MSRIFDSASDEAGRARLSAGVRKRTMRATEIRKVLCETPTKRLRLTVRKMDRNIVMILQEWEVDPADRRWEKMILFKSFHKMVACMACTRVTGKAVESFYHMHLPAAEAVALEWKAANS